MRPFSRALAAVLLTPIAASTSNAETHPRTVAVVEVQLRAAPDILFNHQGPSKLVLASAFGNLEQRVPRGTPFASDPEHYDTEVPALRFELAVPADAAPGDHPLVLTSELYLCDQRKHACFRTERKAEATLHVEQGGIASPLRLEVEARR